MAMVVQDDFVELEPSPKAAAKGSPVPAEFICRAVGPNRAKWRVHLLFRPGLMDAEATAVLRAAPRFSVAFSARQRALRLRANPMGRYELSRVRVAKHVETWLLAMEVPPIPGFVASAKRLSIDIDVSNDGALLIGIPPVMFQQPVTLPPLLPTGAKVALKAPVPPLRSSVDVTASLMGDPPPGRVSR